MRHTKKAVAVFLILFSIGTAALAMAETGGDKTLSPYFFVKGGDSATDLLPLKSTSVTANVAGVIADVTVVQEYKNEGKNPIEAIYIFPASTRAAVYGMKMTIGSRTITAEIKKREEARQTYEKAKEEGKSASLLEEQRPNVFQMNVANILPGDVVKVELKYTELLVPVDGVYDFVYPTVVGPRYSNTPEAAASPSEKWSANPYLHEKEQPTSTFDISLRLTSGIPIQEATCTTHKAKVAFTGKTLATVTLEDSEKYGGNKDFIVKYRLAGGKIESGLLLYEGDKEKFFLLMVEPPKSVTSEAIPPREYIFVVDVSGSMHGFPLDISKGLMKDLLGKLRPEDRFNVLLFSGASQVMAEQSVTASTENIQKAITLIERQQGGGGTELLPALKRALAMPVDKKGVSRTVVIVTDGFVTVEKEAFDLIRNNLGNANMFSFGIGSSVNRYLIEGMARAGKGEPFVITKPQDAQTQAAKFKKLIETPVLTGITVHYDGFEAYDVEPPSIPDVLAERPVIITGKWKEKETGSITVKGMSGKSPFEQKIAIASAKAGTDNSALKYLWARERIAILSDYIKLGPDDERVKEVTNLGLAYSLLTPYTSFVAVDSEVRNKDGKATTVKQPLPLPEGVSDLAVGAGMPVQRAMHRALPAAPPAAPYGAGKIAATDNTAGDEKAKTLSKTAQSEQAAPEQEVKEMQDKPAKKDEKDTNGKPAKVEEAQAKHTMRIEDIAVTKGLDQAAIASIINKEMKTLEHCLSAVAKGQSIVVKLTLDNQGKLVKVEVLPATKGKDEMVKCLMEQLKGITFPATTAGEVQLSLAVM